MRPEGGLASWFAIAWICLGCGSNAPPAYLAQMRAAEAARVRGFPGEAARHWELAAAHAGSARDRDDARYRAAQSHLRAGNRAAATQQLVALSKTAGSERQERARFDLAYLAIEASPTRAAYEQLKQAVLAAPDSGLAARAIGVYGKWTEAQFGIAHALTELGAFEGKKSRTDETARYLGAQLRERAGMREDAISAYRKLVARYPYPEGAYWNDAILRTVELLVQSQQLPDAARLLREMLGHREQASWIGSYERSYAKAHFRLAELQEQLRTPSALLESERLFASFGEQFPDSRLRDDALWRAALLAKRRGAHREACAFAHRLETQSPDSRFVKCLQSVCPELPSRDCADYILRELDGQGANGEASSGALPPERPAP